MGHRGVRDHFPNLFCVRLVNIRDRLLLLLHNWGSENHLALGLFFGLQVLLVLGPLLRLLLVDLRQGGLELGLFLLLQLNKFLKTRLVGLMQRSLLVIMLLQLKCRLFFDLRLVALDEGPLLLRKIVRLLAQISQGHLQPIFRGCSVLDIEFPRQEGPRAGRES